MIRRILPFNLVKTILLSGLLSVFAMNTVFASNASIRLYKLNNKGQLINQRWLGDTDEEGCHNLRAVRKVHRFAQVGYSYCELYREKGCSEGSQVAAKWRGSKYRKADIDVKQPQQRLLPGSNWYLDPDKNIEIASWYCQR